MKHILPVLSAVGFFLILLSSVESAVQPLAFENSVNVQYLVELHCIRNSILLEESSKKKIENSINTNLSIINQTINNPEDGEKDTDQICEAALHLHNLGVTGFSSVINNSLKTKRRQNEVKSGEDLWTPPTFPQREATTQINSFEYHASRLAKLLNKYLEYKTSEERNPGDSYLTRILSEKSNIGDTIRMIKGLLPKVNKK